MKKSFTVTVLIVSVLLYIILGYFQDNNGNNIVFKDLTDELSAISGTAAGAGGAAVKIYTINEKNEYKIKFETGISGDIANASLSPNGNRLLVIACNGEKNAEADIEAAIEAAVYDFVDNETIPIYNLMEIIPEESSPSNIRWYNNQYIYNAFGSFRLNIPIKFYNTKTMQSEKLLDFELYARDENVICYVTDMAYNEYQEVYYVLQYYIDNYAPGNIDNPSDTDTNNNTNNSEELNLRNLWNLRKEILLAHYQDKTYSGNVMLENKVLDAVTVPPIPEANRIEVGIAPFIAYKTSDNQGMEVNTYPSPPAGFKLPDVADYKFYYDNIIVLRRNEAGYQDYSGNFEIYQCNYNKLKEQSIEERSKPAIVVTQEDVIKRYSALPGVAEIWEVSEKSGVPELRFERIFCNSKNIYVTAGIISTDGADGLDEGGTDGTDGAGSADGDNADGASKTLILRYNKADKAWTRFA